MKKLIAGRQVLRESVRSSKAPDFSKFSAGGPGFCGSASFVSGQGPSCTNPFLLSNTADFLEKAGRVSYCPGKASFGSRAYGAKQKDVFIKRNKENGKNVFSSFPNGRIIKKK